MPVLFGTTYRHLVWRLYGYVVLAVLVVTLAICSAFLRFVVSKNTEKLKIHQNSFLARASTWTQLQEVSLQCFLTAP